MLDAILGLLQQSPPSAETKFSKSLLRDLQSESLLKDREPRQSLLANNQELDVTPVPFNPGELQEIATMVANDQKIPSDFLISNVLDPIAWHESHNYIENTRNPGIPKGARMNPLQKQVGKGPGRGLFQFEGRRGVPKKDKNGKKIGLDSFDVAINRAKNYFKHKTLSVPGWINNIQPGDDATSLTADQQKSLALLNFTRINSDGKRTDKSLKKLYDKSTNNANYEAAIEDFWSSKHHTRPSAKQKKDFRGSFKNISKKRSYLNIESDLD